MEAAYANRHWDSEQLSTGGRQVEKIATGRGLSPMTPLALNGGQ